MSGQRDRAFALIAVIFVMYCVAFVVRTSFVVGEGRVYCLFDDAMISMTYARNFVEGFGLTYARTGVPVEGFTHPLWVLLMIGVNLLPVEIAHRSLVVQLFSAALLVLHLFVVRRLVTRHFSVGESRNANAAVLLTAAYFPLNHWALWGMETGLLALLTSAAVLFTLDVLDGSPRVLRLAAVLGAGLLVRLDVVLLVVMTMVVVLANGERRKSLRSRRGLAALAILLGPSLAYLAFRLGYYHEWLPNTYYLKMTGVPADTRLVAGLMAYVGFARPLLVPLFVIALGLSQLARTRRGWLLPGGIFAAYSLYSMYIGGDAWEWSRVGANRFIAFTVPMVFVVAVGLINATVEWLREQKLLRFPAAYLVAPLVAALVLTSNGLWSGDQLNEKWQDVLLANRPLHAPDHANLVGELKQLSKNIDSGATVAVSWAGLPGYFTDWKLADTLGYNDSVIAHKEASLPLGVDQWRDLRPGHVKWDLDYVIRAYQPDAFWEVGANRQMVADMNAFLPKQGYRQEGSLWLRNSPHIKLPLSSVR